jgi:hypothetical protein
MSLIQTLRYNRFVLYGYRRVQDAFKGIGWGGFHGDRVYQSLVLELVRVGRLTSFVETGTSRGYSTELVASRWPKLPVVTAEVLPTTFRTARMALHRYPNVTQKLGSSEHVLAELVGRPELLGESPLFYLDAHWEEYWPLRDELRIIAKLPRAVIVIDDFLVPGQPQFGFDRYPSTKDSAPGDCDLDYIRPSLDRRHAWAAAFPKYQRVHAFPPNGGTDRDPLRGHIVLFQNMPDAFAAFMTTELAQAHYFSTKV